MDLTQIIAQQVATLQRQVATLQALETTSMPLFNVRSWGATADLADHTQPIMDAVVAIQDAGGGVLYFPAGDYIVDSSVGLTNHAYSILINGVDHVEVRGEPGARLLFRNGAFGRPFVIRSCTSVLVTGLELVYDKTDGGSIDGLSIQNCSDVTIWRNNIHGMPHYGVVVSERSDNWGYRSTVGLTFQAATRRIFDANNGITGLSLNDTFFITGSAFNDDRYTAVALAPDGSYVQVAETLVDEAPLTFKTLIIDSDISFDAGTQTITNPDGNGFTGLVEGQLIQVVNSTFNDGVKTIADIDANFEMVRVEEPLITEAAGATVTIQTAAHPAFSQLLATACDNLVIWENTIEHCGTLGIEAFPKVKSANQIIGYNRIYDCGVTSGIGAGLKGAQAYINSIIVGNIVDDCYMGIALGFGDMTYVLQNQVINFHTYGVVNTLGTHPRFSGASMDGIVIAGNEIGFTTMHGSVTPATPHGVPFVSPSHVAFGVNITGINEVDWTIPTSPVPTTQFRGYVVDGNHFFNLPCSALGINTSRARLQNIFWLNNQIVDCLNACGMGPAVSQATVTDGSPIITNIQTYPDLRNSTSGWYEGSGLFPLWWTNAAYQITLPAGTTVVSIDRSLRTMMLSNPISVLNGGVPVVGAQAATRMSSDYPDGLNFVGNHIRNTRRPGNSGTKTNGVVHIFSYNARILRNVVENGSAYAFQVRGDGTLIEGNEIFGHYANYVGGSPVTNAVILIEQGGTYTVKNNHIHSKLAAAPAVTAFVHDLGAQTPSGPASVTIYMADSNTSMVGAMPDCIDHPALPLQRITIDTGLDPGAVAFVDAAGQLAGDATNLAWLASSHFLGIGVATPLSPLHVADNDAATNTITTGFRLMHATSGTPVGGGVFGTRMRLLGTSDSTGHNTRTFGDIEATWGTATDATRKAILRALAFDTAGREGWRIVATGAAANFGVVGGSDFGGGEKVVAIPNAMTVPGTNPSGGGVLYVESGALKYRGSSGTITILGPA